MHRIYMVIGRLSAVLPVLLVVTVLATGCSFKSVYNRLDILIVEYVEGLVTLDDTLETGLEQRAELLLDWHRTTQLKQYATWFREMQADTGPHLDDETLRYHVLKLETYWQNIMVRLNADMAEFLSRLSAAQQAELFGSLDDRNEDYRDDYVELDDDTRLENYIERITDMYEDWLGDLSDDQQLAVESAAERLESGAARRLELRLQWQAKIREVLQADIARQQKEQQLSEYFDSFDINQDHQLRPIDQANQAVLRELTMEIVHSLSPEQKTYFDYRTDEYIRMFEELAENR
jgi:hypothetical protein